MSKFTLTTSTPNGLSPGELLFSELILLGLIHWDPFVSQRIPYCLDRLKPDIITYEFNKEDYEIFNEKTAEARGRFHQALSASSLTLDQQRALINMFLSREEMLEPVAVQEYASQNRVPFYLVDEHSEENEYLIDYVIMEYNSFVTFLKVGFDTDSLHNQILGSVLNNGLEATLQIKGKYYEQRYLDYALHFLGGELSRDAEEGYQNGRHAGHYDFRDLKMSQRIKEAMVAGKRLVHIGGAGHFVDRPLTVYRHLRELNPRRLVIHPQWFEKGLEKV